MNYETIYVQTDGPVVTIRLNRPERMNAVNEEMYTEIQDILEGFRNDPDVRCLILTGSVLERGGIVKQAFCAGADLKKHAAGERNAAQREAYIRLAHETVRKIYTFPKPVIAAVNGPARGAGAEMAISCDFILMAEEATLGFSETGLGTFVGGGVTHILPHLIGLAKAKELIYTGRIVDGRIAEQLGLAFGCYSSLHLLEEAKALASKLAEKGPISIAFAKEYLQRSPGLDIEAALELETKAILTCMESEDWQEGLRAFSEKRSPRFVGR
ncbi:enoyl-CoA hydratase/isomerase family protein [Acidobacteriota bacterium]